MVKKKSTMVENFSTNNMVEKNSTMVEKKSTMVEKISTDAMVEKNSTRVEKFSTMVEKKFHYGGKFFHRYSFAYVLMNMSSPHDWRLVGTKNQSRV